jgi:TusA-related sulfurtransferase
VTKDHELKINARGLSNPGPRMMVETALSDHTCSVLRVIVSNAEAVEDLRDYFEKKQARIDVDQIGDDFHIFVDFSSGDSSSA